MRTVDVNPVHGPKAEIISTRLIPPPADLHSAGVQGSALIRSFITAGKTKGSRDGVTQRCLRSVIASLSVSLSPLAASRWGGTPLLPNFLSLSLFSSP